METDYIVCVRDVTSEGEFGNEPGEPMYLAVPHAPTSEKQDAPAPRHVVAKDDPTDKSEVAPKKWVKQVMTEAAPLDHSCRDLLLFIHGYNTDLKLLMLRHRQLREGLKRLNLPCVVVSFAWPSAGQPLAYLEDRHDGKETAHHFVDGCIVPLARQQQNGCKVNVHVLAHSTGPYILREAFDDADDCGRMPTSGWMVSQIMLIGADLSSDSLSANDSTCGSLVRHCARLTNYWSHFDRPLSLSGVKRMGVKPRAGRVGLPADADPKCVDVDCSEYWELHGKNRENIVGDATHSWYLGDPVFEEDMVETMKGDVDRHRIKTRIVEDGNLVLTKPA